MTTLESSWVRHAEEALVELKDDFRAALRSGDERWTVDILLEARIVTDDMWYMLEKLQNKYDPALVVGNVQLFRPSFYDLPQDVSSSPTERRVRLSALSVLAPESPPSSNIVGEGHKRQ